MSVFSVYACQDERPAVLPRCADLVQEGAGVPLLANNWTQLEDNVNGSGNGDERCFNTTVPWLDFGVAGAISPIYLQSLLVAQNVECPGCFFSQLADPEVEVLAIVVVTWPLIFGSAIAILVSLLLFFLFARLVHVIRVDYWLMVDTLCKTASLAGQELWSAELQTTIRHFGNNVLGMELLWLFRPGTSDQHIALRMLNPWRRLGRNFFGCCPVKLTDWRAFLDDAAVMGQTFRFIDGSDGAASESCNEGNQINRGTRDRMGRQSIVNLGANSIVSEAGVSLEWEDESLVLSKIGENQLCDICRRKIGRRGRLSGRYQVIRAPVEQFPVYTGDFEMSPVSAVRSLRASVPHLDSNNLGLQLPLLPQPGPLRVGSSNWGQTFLENENFSALDAALLQSQTLLSQSASRVGRNSGIYWAHFHRLHPKSRSVSESDVTPEFTRGMYHQTWSSFG